MIGWRDGGMESGIWDLFLSNICNFHLNANENNQTK